MYIGGCTNSITTREASRYQRKVLVKAPRLLQNKRHCSKNYYPDESLLFQNIYTRSVNIGKYLGIEPRVKENCKTWFLGEVQLRSVFKT